MNAEEGDVGMFPKFRLVKFPGLRVRREIKLVLGFTWHCPVPMRGLNEGGDKNCGGVWGCIVRIFGIDPEE